jgi:dolichol-phosphate mannosyltransferase
MKTLVLVPTYNERDNVVPLLTEILNLPVFLEVLVIDDGSPDGTAALVTEHFEANERVHLLKRSGKMGLGTAYAAGFHYALEKGYDAAVTMDADFSHNPAHIPELIAASNKADLVIGSRYVPGGKTVNWGRFRILISRIANLMAHTVLSLQPSDCTSGFRLYHCKTLREVDFEGVVAEGYSYLVEILYRVESNHMRIAEIPITFIERRAGKSKISRKEILKAIQTILRLRFGNADKSKRLVIQA